MGAVKCFFLHDTGEYARFLRRYSDKKCHLSSNRYGCHDVMVRVANGKTNDEQANFKEFKNDPRWPSQCECGYFFTVDDAMQVFCDSIMQRSDTREFIALRDAPAGAMWYADHMIKYHPEYEGPDGHSLAVKTPGGVWMIDSRCTNCTKPNDTKHKCWVRHGEVPNITVDKNGDTCGAGAGSILIGKYHAFLKNGMLVEC